MDILFGFQLKLEKNLKNVENLEDMSNSLFYIYKYSRSNSVDGNIGVLRIEIFDVDCFKFPGNCKNLLCRYSM